jgi:hypothetical protein
MNYMSYILKKVLNVVIASNLNDYNYSSRNTSHEQWLTNTFKGLIANLTAHTT